MGKLDVGVGDEFPVDEPPPTPQETEEAVEAARAEWRHQKDEWRQRKDEWRQHRQAFKEEMRTRGKAFKDDVRRSFHANFGDRPYGRWGGGFAARVLIVLGVLALVIALLPFLFMFGFFALAAALFFVALTRGRHGDYPPGRPSA